MTKLTVKEILNILSKYTGEERVWKRLELITLHHVDPKLVK